LSKYCHSITFIYDRTMTLKKEKRVMVHDYLTEEEKKRIEESASKLGISVSAYIKVKLFMKNDS